MISTEPVDEQYMKGLRDGHNNCLRKMTAFINNEVDVLERWNVEQEFCAQLIALRVIEHQLEDRFEWVSGDMV